MSAGREGGSGCVAGGRSVALRPCPLLWENAGHAAARATASAAVRRVRFMRWGFVVVLPMVNAPARPVQVAIEVSVL
jgi:hypothetical protein